jgi:hypothetical protein
MRAASTQHRMCRLKNVATRQFPRSDRDRLRDSRTRQLEYGKAHEDEPLLTRTDRVLKPNGGLLCKPLWLAPGRIKFPHALGV